VLSHKAKFAQLFGEKVVDAKLFKELNYCREPEVIKKAPAFKGKDFLYQKNIINQNISSEKYAEAARQIEKLMANPGEFKKEFCNFLRFTARKPLYQETSPFWEKQCLLYAQYVAYNNPDRRDAISHFDYAKLLEHMIRKMPEAGKYIPSEIVEKPVHGKTRYSLRPDKLKPKPRKKNKNK